MKVDINGVSITLTQEQLDEIAKQTASRKFEFRYGDRLYELGSTDARIAYNQYIAPRQILHGRCRQTKPAADAAVLLNQRVNRLHALAEQLGGLKNWIYNEDNWYIYYEGETWDISSTCYDYYPEQVYMTFECACKIRDMLNNKEFELNPKGETKCK